MSKEIWKPIPGFGGHYEASSFGRIRVLPRTVTRRSRWGRVVNNHYQQRTLSHHNIDSRGRVTVHIGVDGIKYSVFVHRLVLLAFHGEPPPDQEACHNNGFAWCNRPRNLRWDTHTENNRDRVRHGTIPRGDAHPLAVIPEELALSIKRGEITAADASRKFGISYKIGWRIARGDTWRHLV